jgi:gluconolactonase
MPAGFLVFSDIPANRIYRLEVDGKAAVWRADSGSANGLTLDANGCLLACEHGNRRVSVTRADGTVEALAERWEGRRFNSPNDAALRLADGSLYFTDPPYGLANRPREIDFQGVFRAYAGGRVECLLRDFRKPNGIAFSPDQDWLYVADTEAGHVRIFSVGPDGVLAGGHVLAEVKTPDGLKVDTAGRLFVTSADGVVVLAPDGSRLTTLVLPEVPANCAFGDADGKTLYVTARKSVYRVRVVTPGIVPGRARPDR